MAYNDMVQTETLKNIARQMAIANRLNLLRELHELGAITTEVYTSELRAMEKVT